MEWWHKVVFPVRKVWSAVSARPKPRKNDSKNQSIRWISNVCAGLLKLHDDVQTCGYEDVQIMWEMLRRTEPEVVLKRKNRRFWRNLI